MAQLAQALPSPHRALHSHYKMHGFGLGASMLIVKIWIWPKAGHTNYIIFDDSMVLGHKKRRFFGAQAHWNMQSKLFSTMQGHREMCNEPFLTTQRRRDVSTSKFSRTHPWAVGYGFRQPRGARTYKFQIPRQTGLPQVNQAGPAMKA